ncbi:M-like protein [hydrothermal vent metagenome]|uniref:M-like protein n=1 Tax=hydrothermal vent metagenome TaxID=652676 RepID=A0A1W1CUX3_9ZZZZ
MNKWKLFSGFVALAIYLGLIFLVLYFYNIHKTKAKNYVEKNSNRVTVTLVNSDKTVFNKSSKVSTPHKPKPVIVPPVHIKRPKHIVKRVIKPKPKPKHIVKRVVKPKPKPKHIPKKVVKPKPKPKHIPKKVVKPKPKPKHIPKKVVKPKPKPKHIPKKVVKPKPKPVPKKTAKDLFSSIKTKDVTKHIKREPKHVKRPIVIPKAPSRIKHNSAISDRIKSTHQSGRVSNANRDRGIKNAYIAKVKRHMNNWNAGSAYKGKRVSLTLTIYNSGKFSYRIISGGDEDMKRSLKEFLDRLNRMRQLGGHSKSSPYSIKVNFIVK